VLGLQAMCLLRFEVLPGVSPQRRPAYGMTATDHELDAAAPQDLAGVVLTKPELEVTSKVVRAEIVNYPQNNPEDPPHVPPTSKSGSSCLVQ